MKITIQKFSGMLLILTVLVLASCLSSNPTVTRTAADETVDLSGRWNDTDSRLVAEEMIKDVLIRPWLNNFVGEEGRKPVIIVGTVRNKSSEHIEVTTFIKDIERELLNSGQVKIVASSSQKEETRKMLEDQQSFASESTAKRLAAETGADYILQGVISSIIDAVEGKKVKYYQIDLELVNLETTEKAWIGTKKIKKIVEQPKASW